MKKSLLKNFSRTLLVLACAFTANYAWADDPDTWTVAGDAALCGTNWDATDTNNDMKQFSDNVYYWSKTGITASGFGFKVVKNHDWANGANAYPSQNYNVSGLTGTNTVLIDFNANTKDIEFHAFYQVVVAGTASLCGSEFNTGDLNNAMVFDGEYTWTKTYYSVPLTANGVHKFKVVGNNNWTYAYPSSDYLLPISEDGEYDVTIKYNFITNEVTATVTPTTPATEVATLKDLINEGVSGSKYTIQEELLGVYKSGNTIWFKDDNKFASKDEPNSSDNNFEIKVADGDMWHSKDATFDQSNWIEVVFPAEVNYDEMYIKNLTGVFTNENGNPKLTITKAVADEAQILGVHYTPNRYCIANFKGTQDGHYTNNGSQVECTYFFVTPKPQEYAEIILAVYNNGTLSMPENRNGVSGTINVDLSKNGNYEPVDGTLYTGFNVIVNKAVRSSMLKAEGDYVVSPVNLTAADIPTAISTVAVSGEVKSVKYVNVAGVVSDRPFQGVNIVVTEYTDGSRTTAKIVK